METGTDEAKVCVVAFSMIELPVEAALKGRRLS
jgi:hypothetical protein